MFKKNRCLIIYPLILFLFLSCNINDYLPQKPTYYNVTFYSNNQIVDVQKVKEGSFVKEIQAPTAQEGKNFLFWSTTPNGKTNYFAYQSAIKSDIDLYAIWEDKNLYTVTFLVDDKPINELAVYEDDIVIFPTIENMDGRYLAFWYTGETILYGTSISVTSDLTIKAMLLPIGVTCDGFSIISIDDSIEELAIPKGITSISPSAGERCFVLKRLVIPSTVKKIGYSAFRQCISLEELILEEGIEEIESSAFSNCSSLSSIVFPKTLRLIGDSAFSGSGKNR